MKAQRWLILAAVLTAVVLITRRHHAGSVLTARPTVAVVGATPSHVVSRTIPVVATLGPAAPIKPGRIYTAADVLDLNSRGDDRVEALYQLTQAGPRATADLHRVVTTPLPADPTRRNLEVSLRITALEALDQLAERGVDVKDSFARALVVHQDGALQTIAMVGLRGIEQGRPAKIKRFIDEMVN